VSRDVEWTCDRCGSKAKATQHRLPHYQAVVGNQPQGLNPQQWPDGWQPIKIGVPSQFGLDFGETFELCGGCVLDLRGFLTPSSGTIVAVGSYWVDAEHRMTLKLLPISGAYMIACSCGWDSGPYASKDEAHIQMEGHRSYAIKTSGVRDE